MARERLDYAAKYPGRAGYFATCVDEPGEEAETARILADWILRGAIVERVSRAKACAGMRLFVRDQQNK